jgi:hypothetical protein
MPKTATFRASKPKSPARACDRLLIIRPVATISTVDNASCAVIKTNRVDEPDDRSEIPPESARSADAAGELVP